MSRLVEVLTKRKSWSIAVGSWILAAALGLVSSAWPDLIRPYPYVVAALIGIGLIMILLPLLRKTELPIDRVQNTMGQPSIIINNNPTISPTITQSASPVRIEQGQVADVPNAQVATSLLSVSPPELIRAHWDRTMWNPRILDEIIVVIWICNEPAALNRLNAPVNDVVATLKFAEGGKQLGYIQRAYWVDESANQIHLPIGDRKGLVIGTLEMPTLWVAYHNLYPFEWQRPVKAGGPWRFRNLKKVPISFSRTLEVEVAILSNNTGLTVQRFEVTIGRDHDGALAFALNELV